MCDFVRGTMSPAVIMALVRYTLSGDLNDIQGVVQKRLPLCSQDSRVCTCS